MIEKNKVVLLDFELRDSNGVLLESSDNEGAFPYIHGIGNFLPILENSLEGKRIGEKINITVKPEDAYGNYYEENVFFIPKDAFKDFHDLYVGLKFHVEIDEGPLLCTIKSIEDERVLVDCNHPYAGKVLNFKFRILNIRDATKEELESGQAHIHAPL